jgi:superfamily I DNA/RNA helicase
MKVDAKVMPANHVLREFLDEIEYLPWLERGCKTDNEKQQRQEGIGEVLSELSKALERGKSLRKFLDDSALASDREDDDLEKKSGATLITLHASKGLEFPSVFLVGLEEGVLPHQRSVVEGTKDEERRLLYVGITRAQQRLAMTYCTVRMKWGQQHACQPSSFIMELDDEHLIHTTYDDIMGAEADEEELGNFFGGLKDFLNG